jgi:hypothetical protein
MHRNNPIERSLTSQKGYPLLKKSETLEHSLKSSTYNAKPETWSEQNLKHSPRSSNQVQNQVNDML